MMPYCTRSVHYENAFHERSVIGPIYFSVCVVSKIGQTLENLISDEIKTGGEKLFRRRKQINEASLI